VTRVVSSERVAWLSLGTNLFTPRLGRCHALESQCLLSANNDPRDHWINCASCSVFLDSYISILLLVFTFISHSPSVASAGGPLPGNRIATDDKVHCLTLKTLSTLLGIYKTQDTRITFLILGITSIYIQQHERPVCVILRDDLSTLETKRPIQPV